jgi:3-oxoacyl-(acyl-carrier-protein) synthase
MRDRDEKTMNMVITGAAIVKANMCAASRSGQQQIKADDLFLLPPLNAILAKKSSRFGRFDQYTRLGCAAAGLALHDAGLAAAGQLRIGFILAGQYGSFVTDLAFYETAAGNGQFASPNLFSYTLPNIMIGECALQFGLTGPTYCLDSDKGRGIGALSEGAWLLAESAVDAILVGWLEVPPPQMAKEEAEAIVLVLEKKTAGRAFQLELTIEPLQGPSFCDGTAVHDIVDVLRVLKMADDQI